MIRGMEQTVRRPLARMAPTASIWALAPARSETNGAQAASRAMISGGRSTGVVSRVGGSSTPPSILVNDPLDLRANLAKVELQKVTLVAQALKDPRSQSTNIS